MNRAASWTVTLLFFLALLPSCRKEYSIENNRSDGSLLEDLNNNCLASAEGLYVTGKKLKDSNFILVQVHVARRGSYGITTDTVNGYFFSSVGSFHDTGNIQVKLAGAGTPQVSGTDLFSIRYDSSVCSVSIAVTDSAHIAAYTLHGSPNSCQNDTVKGSYIKGFALDTSARIVVTLDVTAIGPYAITTDTLNGYYFSGTGVFTHTGTQTIILAGTGTPVNSGTNTFRISGAASSCTFTNTVLIPTVPGPNPDHFPLTAGSLWNYDDLFYKGDTIARFITGTSVINMLTYTIMQEVVPIFAPNTLNFRKTGNDYFEYCSVDKFTNSVKFAPALLQDLNFLKEGLNTGDSWQSPTYSATATFGQQILLRYDFSCRNANGAVSVNNKAFTNVYVVTMRPNISAVGYTPGPTGELYTFYYAKGVGMIYYEENNGYYTQPEAQIRNWIVN